MLSALGQVLPIAVAVALSSVPVTATILILLSPRRNISGMAFLIGWVIGLSMVVVAATLGARALPLSSLRSQQTAFGIAGIVIGAALLTFGIASVVRAIRLPAVRGVTWLRALGSIGPHASFAVALLLNVRPKGLLLGVAAGLAIAGNQLPPRDAVLTGIFYIVISASTVAIPIITTVAMPDRMQPQLVRAQGWLEQNGRLVTALLMVLIGVVLLGAGLSQL